MAQAKINAVSRQVKDFAAGVEAHHALAEQCLQFA